MDFVKENKAFAATSLLAAVFGAYVLKESLKKLQDLVQGPQQCEEEEKLTETVKKIINSPEKSHGESLLKDSHQIHSTPLYKICLTGGPCGGKTTGISSEFYCFC